MVSADICVCVGSFEVSCAFNLVYLVTAEAFPTEYRGTAFALGSVMARVGGMLATLVCSLAKGSFKYIFGSLCLVSGVLSFYLKETKSVVMTDTVEEEDQRSEAD